MNKFRHLAWFIPLLLYSSNALAWGLYTHVYFAQQLLWAVPLADTRFRRAVRAFPGWVMAGACLPDLSLTGQHAGTHDFKQTHQWDTARRLLEQASCDEERAIALGFASHLLVDIIAHNHFVPAHEKIVVERADADTCIQRMGDGCACKRSCVQLTCKPAQAESGCAGAFRRSAFSM